MSLSYRVGRSESLPPTRPPLRLCPPSDPARVRTTKLQIKLLDFGGPDYLTAERMGVSAGQFSKYVTGQKEPPFEFVLAMSRLLRCNPSEIIGFAIYPRPDYFNDRRTVVEPEDD